MASKNERLKSLLRALNVERNTFSSDIDSIWNSISHATEYGDEYGIITLIERLDEKQECIRKCNVVSEFVSSYLHMMKKENLDEADSFNSDDIQILFSDEVEDETNARSSIPDDSMNEVNSLYEKVYSRCSEIEISLNDIKQVPGSNVYKWLSNLTVLNEERWELMMLSNSTWFMTKKLADLKNQVGVVMCIELLKHAKQCVALISKVRELALSHACFSHKANVDEMEKCVLNAVNAMVSKDGVQVEERGQVPVHSEEVLIRQRQTQGPCSNIKNLLSSNAKEAMVHNAAVLKELLKLLNKYDEELRSLRPLLQNFIELERFVQVGNSDLFKMRDQHNTFVDDLINKNTRMCNVVSSALHILQTYSSECVSDVVQALMDLVGDAKLGSKSSLLKHGSTSKCVLKETSDETSHFTVHTTGLTDTGAGSSSGFEIPPDLQPLLKISNVISIADQLPIQKQKRNRQRKRRRRSKGHGLKVVKKRKT